MPYLSDSRLLVLQGLRVKGMATTASLAFAIGLADELVAKELVEAADQGLVRHREGVVTGWSLTADGRVAVAALVADELDRARAREVVEDAYRAFLELNHPLLGACTRWQLRDGGLNDHADAGYDATVICELAAQHDRSVAVTEVLSEALERFGAYGPRLAVAIQRVQAGETEWFTKPLIDSFHTVWFELHEDLLATLGRERSSEGVT